jgi:hypothetical protein
MGLFYDREETDDSIVIRYARYPVLIYVLLPVLVFKNIWSSLLNLDPTVATGICVLIIITVVVDLWKPHKEVWKANLSRRSRFEGSKYSFRKPLTVIISRKVPEIES